MSLSGLLTTLSTLVADRLRGWDPSGYLELNDIALWSAEFKRENEYIAAYETTSSIQSRRGCTPTFLEVEDIHGEAEQFLRVLTEFGVRSVVPSEEDEGGFKVIFTLEATFDVSFKILQFPEASDLDKFVKTNCVHLAWPFWRQHVFSTLKAASLPVPKISLLSPVRKKKPAKKLIDRSQQQSTHTSSV